MSYNTAFYTLKIGISMENSTQKEPHSTAGLINFNVPSIIPQLKQEESWGKSGRSARTLHKAAGMRLVLNVMKAGTEIKPHQASGPISVQCVEGHIHFTTEENAVNLRPGDLLTLNAHIRHSVEAMEESAFLLTIVLPADPEA